MSARSLVTHRFAREAACGCLLATLWAVTPQRADAQLFGDRTLGRPVGANGVRTPLTPIAGLPLAEIGVGRVGPEVGSFVGRGAVARDRFIGRADAAVTALESAALLELDRARAAESRRRRTRNANVLQVGEGQSVGPAYAPRLAISFDYPALSARPNELRVEQSIQSVLQGAQFAGVTVSVADEQATLAGSVDSHKVRELAEAIVYLEPGIDAVVNQIEVAR